MQNIAALEEEKIDLCFARSTALKGSKQPLCINTALSSVYHLVFPADHPFSELDEISVDMIKDIELILSSSLSIIRSELDDMAESRGFSLNVVFASGQILTLLSLVQKGLGITILPGILVNDIDSSLQHRPLVPKIPWEMALIYPQNGFMSLPTKCVCDFMLDYFKAKNNALGE